MRLFVGVGIGDPLAHQVGVLMATLRARATAIAPRAQITWVPQERLHVTVRFLGQVDDDRTQAITAALEKPFRIAPFDLVVSRLGTFPRNRAPKVVWAGISEGATQLRWLEREIRGRFERAGIPGEEREYTPHVTLGRIRDAAGLRAAMLLEGIENSEPGATGVDAVTLFESRLSPKGPTYIVVQRTPLSGL